MEQGRIQARLNALLVSGALQDYEFKVFSQFGEDGIIQHLVSSMKIENKTFIEFGVEDFVESNCRFLLCHSGWSGLVIDGSKENVTRLKKSDLYWRNDLTAKCSFITRDNITALIQEAGFGPEPGILSIDLDGIDYFIWQQLEWMRPAIMVAEYNSVFGPDRKITVPYDPAFVRFEKHHSGLYGGCSLGALNYLAMSRGYSLVGSTSQGVNAFFVRNDLMPRNLRALSVEEAYVVSRLRENPRPDKSLSCMGGDARLELIRGLPVINVITGETEQL